MKRFILSLSLIAAFFTVSASVVTPAFAAGTVCVTRISTSGTASGIFIGTVYNVNPGETVVGSITANAPTASTVDVRITLAGSTTYHGFVPFTATLLLPVVSVTTASADYNGFNLSGSYTWTLQIGSCTTPNAPVGFVLHHITCDVAVYSQPDLDHPTGAAITKGQRWSVSETPVKGADGQNWTEVFVGGYQDGFIPTKCVGAAWQASDGS